MADNKLFGSAAGNIKSVDFTNSKIEIFTEEAFSGCDALQKITFGETCKELKTGVLPTNYKLNQIIFEGETAPSINEQGIDFSSIIIEVPEGKKEDYQVAFNKYNPTASIDTEKDILRYTSTSSLLSNQWLFDKNTGAASKWSETEIPGEITGEELWARFSWSGYAEGKPVSGTFDAKIEKGEYSGYIANMTGTEVDVVYDGKTYKFSIYPFKSEEHTQETLLFTIQPYSELSEKTEYTDSGYTYSFVNVEKPIYGESTYEGEVVLKDDVTSIGDNAFSNNTILITIKTIKLPQQITSIGNNTFSDCASLTSINIPSSLTSIGNNTFNGCFILTSIDLPSSLTSIGVNAFSGCASLTSINIPSSLTSIGVNAFSGCASLTSITVANDNVIYDSRDNCNAIILTNKNQLIKGCQNTIIPNDIDSIGENAFYNCSRLTSITIPNSVTSIGVNAFGGCASLTSIDLPSSIKTIEYRAFANCYYVNSVICRAITPPTLITEKDNTWFSGLKTDTCQVPAESISAYESDELWKEQFKSFVAIQ